MPSPARWSLQVRSTRLEPEFTHSKTARKKSSSGATSQPIRDYPTGLIAKAKGRLEQTIREILQDLKVKIALFVDFDNVYSGLRRISAEAAERFSRHPLVWLRWLTLSSDAENLDETAASHRRVLVRRCYLNPVMYQKYRRPFHEAGFEIVDCPPMTATGKTSTDIHLVLDTMDALMDETHFDEFIVFSADADFSPVLRRLRRHDRRTVVFAAGAMSESYKASADKVIDIQTFLREALELDEEEEELAWQPGTSSVFSSVPDLRARVIDCIRKVVLQADSPVPLAALAQLIQRDVAGIREGHWDGAGSFSNLIRDLEIPGIEINLQEDAAIDSQRRRDFLAQRAAEVPKGLQSEDGNQENSRPALGVLSLEALKDSAAAVIKQEVANSSDGVLLSALGQMLRKTFPQFCDGWPGAKNLAGFLKQLQLQPLESGVLEDGATFVMYDPARHDSPGTFFKDRVVASMLRAAEVPAVRGRYFVRILAEVMQHMGSDKSFEIAEVSRRIATSMNATAAPITPRRVAAVLQALIFGGLNTERTYESQTEIISESMGVIVSAWVRETQAQPDDEARGRLIAWLELEPQTT